MLTSKIRITLAAFVAASGLAFAVVVPAASQAATNTGGFYKSAEWLVMKGQVCTALSKEATREEALAAKFITEGRLDNALGAATEAGADLATAHQLECGFS